MPNFLRKPNPARVTKDGAPGVIIDAMRRGRRHLRENYGLSGNELQACSLREGQKVSLTSHLMVIN